MDDVRVAEAGVEHRVALDPGERAVDRLERVLARRLGPRLQVRLVDLDDVRSGRLEVVQLLVDGLGVREREVPRLGVVVVLGLLRHRERPRDGDLDPPVGDRAQQLDVADLHRARPADRPHHARDRVRVARAVERDARVVEVDAVEGRRKAVRVALPPHLPVGDDVDARELHVLHGEPRRVVLRFLEVLLRDPPELERAHARWEPVAEPLTVDQPVGLRVAADDGCDQSRRARRGIPRSRHETLDPRALDQPCAPPVRPAHCTNVLTPGGLVNKAVVLASLEFWPLSSPASRLLGSIRAPRIGSLRRPCRTPLRLRTVTETGPDAVR